jgi:hypothetical protein
VDDARSASSPSQSLAHLLALVDSLSIIITSPEKSVESRASTVTAGELDNGLIRRCLDDCWRTSMTRPLDSTFEGFVLSRLMASESDEPGE